MDTNNFNCPVCTHIVTFPRIYDCGHSLCEDCMVQIDNEANKISETSNKAPIYKCPICRKNTHKSWFNRPRNLFLMGILENNSEYKQRVKEKIYQNNPLDNIPIDVNLSLLCKRSRELKFNELYNYIVTLLTQASLDGKDNILITEKTSELHNFSSKIANKLFEEHGIYKVISNINIFKIFIIEDQNIELNGGRFAEYINSNYISQIEEDYIDEEEIYLTRAGSYIDSS